MNAASSSILVFAGSKFVCIKLVGRVNFSHGVHFKTLLNEIYSDGFSYFVVDLADCDLLDSTILGLLTGFGLRLRQRNGEEAPNVVELRNPHARVEEVLENLGVLQLFKVTRGSSSTPACLHEIPKQAATPSRVETTRACLEAHQTLASISPELAAKFKDVTKFLAEDLRRLDRQCGNDVNSGRNPAIPEPPKSTGREDKAFGGS